MNVHYNALPYLTWGSKCAQGPNGLYVPVNENWCDSELCDEWNKNEGVSASCKANLCHFDTHYGKNENIQGILTRNNVVLCNSSVSVNATSYRLVKMAFGYRTIPSQNK